MLTVIHMPDENRQKTILVQRKNPEDIDNELSALCRMMRIMSERDTDGTLPQVLKVMMVEGRGKPVGGSELSRVSGLNRITVIHHLKRLEGAGFVRRQEGKYVLRVQTAEDMLIEFRKEMEKSFAEMDEMARQIDEQFESFEREFEERHRKRRQP
jgi:DNA-binding MarR family transcriptional regulator